MSDVKIGEQVIVIDSSNKISAWLDRYLEQATEDPFFYPKWNTDISLSGQDSSTNFYFESTLPELPPIKLGCIQWPCVGTVRFARGMFAVDRHALAAILSQAWGSTWQAHQPIPDEWTRTANNAIQVLLVENVLNPNLRLALKMFVLPPIKVSESTWIVRLVDLRYFKQSDIGPVGPSRTTAIDRLDEESPVVGFLNIYQEGDTIGDAPEVVEGWFYSTAIRQTNGKLTDIIYYVEEDDAWVEKELDPNFKKRPTRSWEELATDFLLRGFRLNFVRDSAMTIGVPDVLFANSNSPIPHMVDAFCYSVGCRPVVPTRQSSQYFVDTNCQREDAARDLRQSLLSMAKITGGQSHLIDKPSSLCFICPNPWSFYSGHQKDFSRNILTDGKGITLTTYCTMNYHLQLDTDEEHCEWSPRGILTDYTNSIASTIRDGSWNEMEYSVCLEGIQDIVPSGHDDYIEWEWTNKPTTKVKSLPSTFFPRGLLAQHPIIEDDDDPETPPPESPWFSLHRNHAYALVLDNYLGQYNQDILAFENVLANVQIIDDSLFIAGTESTFHKAQVKALVAMNGEVFENEIVEIHFCDNPIREGTSNVKCFTGWSINRASVDSLERFKLSTTWSNGSAGARFVNLSNPDMPIQNGTVKDPLAIFSPLLQISHIGLSIRTRRGEHYVIQANCNQGFMGANNPELDWGEE